MNRRTRFDSIVDKHGRDLETFVSAEVRFFASCMILACPHLQKARLVNMNISDDDNRPPGEHVKPGVQPGVWLLLVSGRRAVGLVTFNHDMVTCGLDMVTD